MEVRCWKYHHAVRSLSQYRYCAFVRTSDALRSPFRRDFSSVLSHSLMPAPVRLRRFVRNETEKVGTRSSDLNEEAPLQGTFISSLSSDSVRARVSHPPHRIVRVVLTHSCLRPHVVDDSIVTKQNKMPLKMEEMEKELP